MNVFQAILLGIVEGITEYLPISSTFHLIWAAKLLGISQTDFQKMFEVVIQSGAILAVLILYLQTLTQEITLVKKVIISFLPTAIIGLLLYKVIKNVFFENFLLQLGVFVLIGILFIVFEGWRSKGKLGKRAEQITYQEAIMVGLAQALAVIPGVSRAGAVMIAMMYLGVKRSEAAKYSFLLAVPTLLAASALDLVKSRPVLFASSGNLLLLTAGFIASFISALLVVRWFISYLQKHDISVFGWYRLGVAVLLLLATTFIR